MTRVREGSLVVCVYVGRWVNVRGGVSVCGREFTSVCVSVCVCTHVSYQTPLFLKNPLESDMDSLHSFRSVPISC